MAELFNLDAYRDAPIAPRPLEKDGDGGDSGGMEPRIARLEAHMENVRADVGSLKTEVGALRTEVSAIKVNLATLTERVAHLPSKGFIVSATLTALGAAAAFSLFGPNIRALLGLH